MASARSEYAVVAAVVVVSFALWRKFNASFMQLKVYNFNEYQDMQVSLTTYHSSASLDRFCCKKIP